MARIMLIVAWVELILGIIGSAYSVVTGGIKDTNTLLMVSGGLLIACVCTYFVHVMMMVGEHKKE